MSATKRRAGAVASPELSTPDPSKRRKRNDDTHFPDEETVETTREIGMKLMRSLKTSKDKNGREIAVHFIDLPSKDEYPQYYLQVKMPISLNMVENRLQNGEYDNLEKLESDLKRLVQNAKEFNSTKSEVYEDAERIRKAMSNFMPKHNPAYLNTNYRAYPTPIPRELLDRDVEMSDSMSEANGHVEKVKLVFSTKSSRRKSEAISVDQKEEEENDEEDDQEEEEDQGDIKSAQLALLDELAEMPDAPNFYEKPSKKIPGYYATIKQPTSISDVRKLVEKGRFTDWNSFATEVRLIWDNAKQFNEDGSEIYIIAVDLEEWFEEKVQALGASPRAKIVFKPQSNEPKRIKLSIGTGRSTPNLAGGFVDAESLRRQRDDTIQASARMTRPNSRSAILNGSVSGASVPASVNRSGSTAASSDRQGSAMAGEDNRAASIVPVPDAVIPPTPAPATIHTSKSLPTPAVDGQPPSVQPMPSANGSQDNEVIFNHPGTRNLFAESDNPIERKYRDPGKGIKDAILGSVTFMTHPKLPSDPKWKLSRYASATKTQTCSYIYLPSDHYYLRVVPNLTDVCLGRKKYKVCVTRNWEQIYPSQEVPGVYDFRVHQGENIIAVDVVAELADGDSKPYAPPQLQIDFERIMFIIMLRDRTPE